MTPDLDTEMAAARRVFDAKGLAAVRGLSRLGLTQPQPVYTGTAAFHRLGLMGIVCNASGLYEPAAEADPAHAESWSDGALALIVPVLDYTDSLIDLIAWRSLSPDQFWQRTGFAPLLGETYIGWCLWNDKPVHLHRSPPHWLAAAGFGAVVLDWQSPEAHGLLLQASAVEIDQGDEEFATFVYRWLRRKRRYPQIFFSPLEIIEGGAA